MESSAAAGLKPETLGASVSSPEVSTAGADEVLIESL
jgi:hypothetical protein